MKPIQTGLGAAMLAACLGAMSSMPAAAQDATAFQIDPAHSGVTSMTTRLVLPLTQRWTATLPGPVGYSLIANGLVYAMSAQKLVAYDVVTGAPAWSHTLSEGSIGQAYGDGRIYVLSSGGKAIAFDGVTGARVWTRQLQGQWFFSSPPTFADGKLFVGGAGDGGTLYAIDAATGFVKWTQGVMNGDSSIPTASATSVYVSYACNNTYAFDAATGAPRWAHFGGCEGGGGATTVLDGNFGLYARDDIEGNLLFKPKTGNLGPFVASYVPAVADGVSFAVSGGDLLVRDHRSNTALWAFKGQALVTAPIVVDDTVFVASASTLFARDRATGQALWSTPVDASAYNEGWFNSPVTGLTAGAGVVVVPSGNQIVVYGN